MKVFSSMTCAILLGTAQQALASKTPELTLSMAIEQAQNHDAWLVKSNQTQASLTAQQIAAGTWQDPKIAVAMNNLPSNDFAFKRDNMSQLKVSMSQVLPRGASLQIKQNILALEAQQQPILRADRRAKVAMVVSELWLDAYTAKMTIELINKDAHLFEQLAEISEANYASALGKTRQHDVIRAQVELAQLQDRLVVEQQRLATKKATLLNWLPTGSTGLSAWQFNAHGDLFTIAKALPDDALFSSAHSSLAPFGDETMALLMRHPRYLAQSKEVESAKQSVTLSEQKYKPQWAVNASYGYRADSGSEL